MSTRKKFGQALGKAPCAQSRTTPTRLRCGRPSLQQPSSLWQPPSQSQSSAKGRALGHVSQLQRRRKGGTRPKAELQLGIQVVEYLAEAVLEPKMASTKKEKGKEKREIRLFLSTPCARKNNIGTCLTSRTIRAWRKDLETLAKHLARKVPNKMTQSIPFVCHDNITRQILSMGLIESTRE